MNKTKKALIATTMAGVMAAGAGFGTFSWFTASTDTGESEVQAGTLSLEDISEQNVLNTESALLQPVSNPEDSMVKGKSITIENTGDFELEPRLKLNVNTRGTGGDGDDYKIRMIAGNDNGSIQTDWIDATEATGPVNDWFPDEQQIPNYLINMSPDESAEVKFEVYLDKEAGNNYQGSSLTADLEVEGRQTVDGVDTWDEEPSSN